MSLLGIIVVVGHPARIVRRLSRGLGGYGYGFGHGGMGIVGTILVVVVILLLLGKI